MVVVSDAIVTSPTGRPVAARDLLLLDGVMLARRTAAPVILAAYRQARALGVPRAGAALDARWEWTVSTGHEAPPPHPRHARRQGLAFAHAWRLRRDRANAADLLGEARHYLAIARAWERCGGRSSAGPVPSAHLHDAARALWAEIEQTIRPHPVCVPRQTLEGLRAVADSPAVWAVAARSSPELREAVLAWLAFYGACIRAGVGHSDRAIEIALEVTP